MVESDDVFEMDILAEAEVTKLQKQYRQIENEHNSFIEEKDRQSRKYEKISKILEKERAQLKFQLEAEELGPHFRKETEHQMQLLALQDRMEKVQGVLNRKKANLKEMEEQITKTLKQISQVRENERTETKYNETIVTNHRTIAKLENRLDVVNKRAGVVMGENAILRETIDHMLQERATFNVMWDKLVTRLNDGKKHLMDLIEQATQAYDQREELCNKLQLMKDKGQNDKYAHIQEMRELQRKLDHDAKLQEFLEVKGQRRSNVELEEREAQRKKRMKEELERQHEEYEATMQRIKTFSNEKDVEKLVTKFIKQEEENFALFNYVNELSHEVEALTDTVQLLQEQIDEQREINESKKNKKDESIEALTRENDKFKAMADEAYELQIHCEATLTKLLHGVERIYKVLVCDEAPILYLLGTQDKKVTLNNAKLFLGIVERKVMNIIDNVNLIFTEPAAKILGKPNRVPNFNVKDSAKGGKEQ
ncbi:coiled-coil domain-containing protein 63 [Culicoides brevitarsis]|uniref:coiled-coil domain-containing protein 63 n=1 Tax=Culicoides brevitarsis TaxID=469753 RepID=UPI00307BD94F